MKLKMFFGASPILFAHAKRLRREMTDAEKLLWHHLQNGQLGAKFRRQHPLAFYIADFYCHKAKLVIEVDGSIHSRADIIEYDQHRQRIIEEEGLTVIRFQNEDIFNNIEKVLNEIKKYLPETATPRE